MVFHHPHLVNKLSWFVVDRRYRLTHLRCSRTAAVVWHSGPRLLLWMAGVTQTAVTQSCDDGDVVCDCDVVAA